jgi:uncharacterized protein involved in cysteine biosynthesis
VILDAFTKSLSQMGDPRFLRVLGLGVGLAIALLVAVFFGTQWLIGSMLSGPISLPWVGEVNWLDEALRYASVPAFLIASVFLMVPVASMMTSFFLDTVADAVEDKHYKGLPDTPGVPFFDALKDSIGFLGLMLVVNVLAIILYLPFIFLFPPMVPVIFWAANGALLAREYFTLAAARRIGWAAAKALRKQNRMTLWAAGFLMAVPLSVPVVNLLVPIMGAATFTHLFHKMYRA